MQFLDAEQKDEFAAKLLANLSSRQSELAALFAEYSGEWGYDTRVYAFYNHNDNAVALRSGVERIVEVLRGLCPERELNEPFMEIIREGTRRRSEFSCDDDEEPSDPQHIVEAFFHARFMLEMAVRYSDLKEPPPDFPSGWGTLLHLYQIH